ncbi:hypothetical protein [Thalassorhabdomicrobium marinisediminis]|uniref:Uncharacterized protein n=1 Tax=Thalassorhabdomicrobium marinisediminis TaxID=2170577 RepID=A0A2T7G0U3_9RHOB|nr:hypothetical protein [Thalassorhabdomicrobium marinisediminis]PVA08044.1 hypothetical protein DC363_00655 [Thalassorhabdomicrobium marinisediminis]
MTALPDTFARPSRLGTATPPDFHYPRVSERFWGYEVSFNEQVVDLAVLARGVTLLVTIGAFLAAAAVWLLPDGAFTGAAAVSKALISFGLLILSGCLAHFAGRSTRVQVQVDKNAGELREVVKGLTGASIVLTRHGLDTVRSVTVVPSIMHPSLGQVHVTLQDDARIAVGDGAVTALYSLRDRLSADCGLEQAGSAREAVWSGPLQG